MGGNTVREAKECLTQSELKAWQQYRAEFGPLNIGRRIDYAIARLIFVTRLCHGNKGAKPEDFLPSYGSTPDKDDEPELTPEMFHRMFGEND
ncbi:phage tail assembly protein T [Gilvimarinus agarilyticus]